MSNLRIMDYRNAKYQGETYKYLRNGLGLLLDDHFTLIIGEWNKNQLHGSCVIVYPENMIFYGKYLNGFPDGLAVFQLENQTNLFCTFREGKLSERVVITMERPGILIEAFIEQIRSGIEQEEDIKLVSDQSFNGETDRNRLVKELLKV